MTPVGQPTTGFMSEAALRAEQTLRDQPRQKGRGSKTLGSSAARRISLPSDTGEAARRVGPPRGALNETADDMHATPAGDRDG